MIGLVPTTVKNDIGCKSLFLKSLPPVILASTSTYRRELLARLQIPFECVAPGVDETLMTGEAGLDLVVRLARAKAAAVASQHPNALVIGSDQAAVLPSADGETILGKPGTLSRCVEQLKSCSGQTLSFLTAVTVMRQADGAHWQFVDTTRVKFRVLDEASVERYVVQEPALDCAGGFKCEGLGVTLCESIDTGDPTALIGLPLVALSAILRLAGFSLP
jgi:septum formation protein